MRKILSEAEGEFPISLKKIVIDPEFTRYLGDLAAAMSKAVGKKVSITEVKNEIWRAISSHDPSRLLNILRQNERTALLASNLEILINKAIGISDSIGVTSDILKQISQISYAGQPLHPVDILDGFAKAFGPARNRESFQGFLDFISQSTRHNKELQDQVLAAFEDFAERKGRHDLESAIKKFRTEQEPNRPIKVSQGALEQLGRLLVDLDLDQAKTAVNNWLDHYPEFKSHIEQLMNSGAWAKRLAASSMEPVEVIALLAKDAVDNEIARIRDQQKMGRRGFLQKAGAALAVSGLAVPLAYLFNQLERPGLEQELYNKAYEKAHQQISHEFEQRKSKSIRFRDIDFNFEFQSKDRHVVVTAVSPQGHSSFDFELVNKIYAALTASGTKIGRPSVQEFDKVKRQLKLSFPVLDLSTFKGFDSVELKEHYDTTFRFADWLKLS